jgi:NAD dependent epimerase/dehydratase
MNLQGKRVLVTGAGGFIGSHLAEALVEAGAETRALVQYNANGSWGWLEQSLKKNAIEFILGDIRDRDSVRHAMADRQIVFHLAALIAIPYSYEAPESYVATNVQGTLNVLQAARELELERVVHTSTSEVYGTARYVPIDEAHPLQGQSPYAATKIGADKLAEAFHHSFNVPVVTVRPFNTVGPRQSARAIIPTIVTQCLSGKSLRLGNLHPTRDLNYVSNTVDGFLSAAVAPDALGRTFNIGSGEEISVGDLAEKIMKILGDTVEIETETDRKRPPDSEVDRLVASATLARDLLGWTPSTSFHDGLRLTIDWIRSHLNEYRPEIYSR